MELANLSIFLALVLAGGSDAWFYQMPCGPCGPGIPGSCIPIVMTCRYDHWDLKHTTRNYSNPHPMNPHWPQREFPRCAVESAMGVSSWSEEKRFTCQLSSWIRTTEFGIFCLVSFLVLSFCTYKCLSCLCCCCCHRNKAESKKDSRVVMVTA